MPEARASKRANRKRRPISVSISPDVLEMLDTEAKALRMTRSAFTEIALEDFITRLRERKVNPLQTSIDFAEEYGAK